MKMQARNVLYAAVGAPVVAARKMSEQVSALKGRVSKETTNYTKVANQAFDDWASEGEKVVSRISEGKVVEEISQKVDLDQAKEQVSKLRDQLEDMLATWRTSFRPETAQERAEATEPTPKPAPKPASKKPATKKPATKTSAAKTAKSSTAAKTSSTKPDAAKAKAS